MTGAELLLKTAEENGVDICFANAGTTEIQLVAALDGGVRIRAVLGLFEGVCTGAADGYGRVLDRPAMTLLHLGPGFANGVACLHNARRANAPIVNLIGEHASWHRDADPPLNMDIEALAGTVSGWKKTSRSLERLSRDMASAISAGMTGQIASLIVPSDLQAGNCGGIPVSRAASSFEQIDASLIEDAAKALRNGKRAAIILGGRGLRRDGLLTAARIRAATGCDLLANSFPGYMDRGGALPVVARIPYFPEPARELTNRYDTFVVVGAHDPVTFFGYDGIPSRLIPEKVAQVVAATERHDAAAALLHLADALGAPQESTTGGAASGQPQGLPGDRAPLTAETVSRVIAALQPDDAIIVDEGLTTAFPYYSISHGLAPHGLITIAGGSIGYGMPCSVGAALASPERRVINIQADGSAMYTVQALWTLAREGLNVTTLLCNNGGYRIIDVELQRAGVADPGYNTRRLVDIEGPEIDWVSLSQGLGVPAVRVRDVEELAREMSRSIREPGPRLIEMVLERGPKG